MVRLRRVRNWFTKFLPRRQECGICYSNRPLKKMVDFNTDEQHTGSSFCNKCVVKAIDTLVTSDNHLTCICGCEAPFEGTKLKSMYLTSNKKDRTADQKWVRLDQILLSKCLARDPNIRFCPGIDCPFYAIVDAQKCPIIHCGQPSCKISFCFYCRDDVTNDKFHLDNCPLKGALVSQRLRYGAETMGEEARHCPKCFCPIHRYSGCNHMTCNRCLHEFCWECGASFDDDDDDADPCRCDDEAEADAYSIDQESLFDDFAEGFARMCGGDDQLIDDDENDDEYFDAIDGSADDSAMGY